MDIKKYVEVCTSIDFIFKSDIKYLSSTPGFIESYIKARASAIDTIMTKADDFDSIDDLFKSNSDSVNEAIKHVALVIKATLLQKVAGM